jgi:hypothetical protein
LHRNAVPIGGGVQPGQQDCADNIETGSGSAAAESDDLTHSFVRLSSADLSPRPLSRYEATLWRQACQILFALQVLDRRKPWERPRFRVRNQPLRQDGVNEPKLAAGSQ